MISILCPSRGRPNALEVSLGSLGLDENRLEALVWLDDDDPFIEQYLGGYYGRDVKFVVKPRVFYKNYHMMLNYLAGLARYHWMISWNDDAVMMQAGWYMAFAKFVEGISPTVEPVVVNLWDQEDGGKANLFYAFSRAYFTVLGHVALNTACDNWTSDVARGAGVMRWLKGYQPTHRKFTGDKSHWLVDETYAQVEKERAESEGGRWGYKSGPVRRQIRQDISRLKWYMGTQ